MATYLLSTPARVLVLKWVSEWVSEWVCACVNVCECVCVCMCECVCYVCGCMCVLCVYVCVCCVLCVYVCVLCVCARKVTENGLQPRYHCHMYVFRDNTCTQVVCTRHCSFLGRNVKPCQNQWYHSYHWIWIYTLYRMWHYTGNLLINSDWIISKKECPTIGSVCKMATQSQRSGKMSQQSLTVPKRLMNAINKWSKQHITDPTPSST